MPQLKWSNADEIGYQLFHKYPDTDPLQVRFTDLRQKVLELEEFADNLAASNEKILEAIQMAWLDYYQDR